MLNAFLSLFRGDSPERIVWTADIAYWIAGQKAVDTEERVYAGRQEHSRENRIVHRSLLAHIPLPGPIPVDQVESRSGG